MQFHGFSQSLNSEWCSTMVLFGDPVFGAYILLPIGFCLYQVHAVPRLVQGGIILPAVADWFFCLIVVVWQTSV